MQFFRKYNTMDRSNSGSDEEGGNQKRFCQFSSSRESCSTKGPIDLTCLAGNYSDDALWNLRKAQKDGFLCDYTIKVEGDSIRAHKVVLASASDYFKTLFTCGLADSSKDEIELKGQSYNAIKVLVHYMYSASLEMNSETLPGVLHAASFLQVQSALHLCETEMIDKMMIIENWLEVMTMADMYNLQEVERTCMERLGYHFEYMYHQQPLQYTKVTLHILEKVLGHLETQASERRLFRLLESWMLCDYESRGAHLQHLCKLIGFHFMSRDELVKCVCSDIFERHANGLPIKNEILQSVHAFAIGSRAVRLSRNYNRPRGISGILLLAEGTQGTHLHSSRLLFEPSSFWQSEKVAAMRGRISEAGVGCHDNFVVICGGCDEKEGTQNMCTIFSPSFKQWLDGPFLNIPRRKCSLAGVGDNVYAIGGYDVRVTGTTRTTVFISKMERFNFTKDCWELIGKLDVLPSRPHNVSACAFDDQIFVLIDISDVDDADRDGYPNYTMLCYKPRDNGLTLLWTKLITVRLSHPSVQLVPMSNSICIFEYDSPHQIVLYFNPKTRSVERSELVCQTRCDWTNLITCGNWLVFGGLEHDFQGLVQLYAKRKRDVKICASEQRECLHTERLPYAYKTLHMFTVRFQSEMVCGYCNERMPCICHDAR